MKDMQEFKGLITWRISAQAEISTRLTGLKFCCDYMTRVSGESGSHIISCFSARAEISFRLHESFSARGAIHTGLKILARFGLTRQKCDVLTGLFQLLRGKNSVNFTKILYLISSKGNRRKLRHQTSLPFQLSMCEKTLQTVHRRKKCHQ